MKEEKMKDITEKKNKEGNTGRKRKLKETLTWQ